MPLMWFNTASEKIRIVLGGLRGKANIDEPCRRGGIAERLYYAWSKELLEAGKRRLVGDTPSGADFASHDRLMVTEFCCPQNNPGSRVRRLFGLPCYTNAEASLNAPAALGRPRL